jgi:hypothetical protein
MGNEITGIFYLCRTCSGKRSGFQSAFEEEIRRVMVHGACIIADKDKGEVEELLMLQGKNEMRCSTWNNKNPICF